jgi:hypothetical protein
MTLHLQRMVLSTSLLSGHLVVDRLGTLKFSVESAIPFLTLWTWLIVRGFEGLY